ncbi:RNA-guided endonuclease InsQ/TnpB family protein [Halovenus sp. HT40]|uniref:RNA-guided endonuclease InsQ/TnpB family protein n=1 Tax=Halovenus sp. HT40 TaxID=3126691 RepID=UPI00300EF64E
MHYTYRFRLKPTPEQRELLDYHRDTCRQLYNHALREFEQIPESAGTLNQRVRQVRDQLTDLKEWWDDLNDLYSTVAQSAVMRIEDSIKALSELKRKRRDFLHKLSNYYATEYDLVAVEDLDAKGLGEPNDTTRECASCGVKTDKPLWVRDHFCPSCGFETDRDANAAINILSRGLNQLGVGHSKGTPVETALPVDTPVSAKCVVETGSPILKERTASAVSE